MAAPTVRADYDQLSQVASTFRQNVEAAQQTLQALKSSLATLQGGDWVGQGASAFYQEMDETVLPTWQRLINALDSAANSTAQISAIMKDAEEQAANVLKGPGAGGGSAGVIAGASAAAGSGPLSGLAGAGPIGGDNSLNPDYTRHKDTQSGMETGAKVSGAEPQFVYQKDTLSGMPTGGKVSGAEPQFVYQKDTLSGMPTPKVSQAQSPFIGVAADGSSKDPILNNLKGGLANEGWERDLNSNPAASDSFNVNLPRDAASGLPTGQREHRPITDVGGGANTIGGATGDDWTLPTDGQNTIGGATFKDGWINPGGAPSAGGAGTGGKVFKDGWIGTGGTGNTSAGEGGTEKDGKTSTDDWEDELP